MTTYMTYTATLIHASEFVRIFGPDQAFSIYNGNISEAKDAQGRPAKADVILNQLGFERQQPWKNLSWGLEASVVRLPNNNQTPNKGT